MQGLVPDLTVLLAVDRATAESRRRDRGGAADRMESEAAAFHDAVNAAFRELAALAPSRYLVLDAAAPAEQTTRAVVDRVATLLPATAEAGR